jgi:hypothetical protein
MGEKRIAHWVLVGKPEGNHSLGRSRHRWEDNINTDLGEMTWDAVNWINLVQSRDQWRVLVNMVMNLQVP